MQGSQAVEEDGLSSPLHRSAAQGQSNRLTMLLKTCEPREVDALDADGHTPLFVACALGQARAAALLLRAGASPDHPTANSRSTPLHAACDAGHDIVVATLLHAGAHASMRDVHGLTPLERAEHAGHDVCAGVIKKHLEDKDGEADTGLDDAPPPPLPSKQQLAPEVAPRPQTPDPVQRQRVQHLAPLDSDGTQFEGRKDETTRQDIQQVAPSSGTEAALPSGWESAISRSTGNVYYVRVDSSSNLTTPGLCPYFMSSHNVMPCAGKLGDKQDAVGTSDSEVTNSCSDARRWGSSSSASTRIGAGASTSASPVAHACAFAFSSCNTRTRSQLGTTVAISYAETACSHTVVSAKRWGGKQDTCHNFSVRVSFLYDCRGTSRDTSIHDSAK